MTGFTSAGQQAYAILSWANEDPPGRAREAESRVYALARAVMSEGDTAALSEVRDAGTVITRLADAIRTAEDEAYGGSDEGGYTPQQVPAAFSGIASQVIDLAPFDPAKHLRGPNGKFITMGDADGGFAKMLHTSMARQPGRNPASIGAAFGPSMKSGGKGPGPAADIDKILGNLKESFPQVAEQGPNPRIASQEDVMALENRLGADIKRAHGLVQKMEEEEKERNRAELAVELLAVGAGVALAFFTGGLSLSLAAIAPFLVKALVEHGPDIAKALMNYHVAGKGKGREWLAHPVKKTAVSASQKATAARLISHQARLPRAVRPKRHPPPSTT